MNALSEKIMSPFVRPQDVSYLLTYGISVKFRGSRENSKRNGIKGRQSIGCFKLQIPWGDIKQTNYATDKRRERLSKP